MLLIIDNKFTEVLRLWHKAVFEGLRAGVILGGVFYGVIIFPFFMTLHQSFRNFLGEAILGLSIGIPTSILTAFFTSLISGLIVALLSTFCFYPVKNQLLYRITIGLIGIICSVIGILLALNFFQNAPFYAYKTLSWDGSEFTLITIAVVASWWATRRFAKWYGSRTIAKTW